MSTYILKLDELIAMTKTLDEADVPKEDRGFMYIDMNGKTEEVYSDTYIGAEQMKLMPPHIKELFIGGER